MIEVRNVSGQDPLYLDDIGAVVPRGGTVRVSEEFAGREPGEWVEQREPVDGWPFERLEDDAQGPRYRVQDPGHGLLAQVGVWERVSEPTPPAAPPARPRVATDAAGAAEGATGAGTGGDA